MKQPLTGIVIAFVIIAAIVGSAYWFLSHHNTNVVTITSFEECAAAGYPIQESYPRRCAAGATTFTEVVATSTPEGGTVRPVATSSKNIRVTAPVPYQNIGLPLVISGEAREFENSFAWRLRDADRSILVEGYGTADAPDTGQFGSFTVVSSYPEPKGKTGIVEVFAYSAKDGSQIDTVSIPVSFQSVESMIVKVYFSTRKEDPNASDCSTTYPVSRRIAKTSAPATAALNELLRGTTYAEGGGEGALFSNINLGTKLLSLRIEQGTAHADFDELLTQGVAGSCRVIAIQSQIEHTLMQFPTVKRVIISVRGKTDVLQP